LFSKIPSWLLNKYLLATTFFVVWMFFFDPKDIASDLNRRAKYRELQKSEQHLDRLISDTRKELDLLKTNAQTIEKYAREKYMMKKDNEDLFIINTPPANN
jgi:cell division protein DivIC